MIGCGTSTFTDPHDFRAHVPGLKMGLVLTGSDPFRVHVTWADLLRLRVLGIEERSPRVGFVSLASGVVCISFPVRSDPPAYWNGVRLQRGEIVLHALGERFHQRTTGPVRWGLIALAPADLDAYGVALLGKGLAPPRSPAILRLLKPMATEFLRLHRQICRLANDQPELIAHREVARALEQDLVSALVNGLSTAETIDNEKACHRRAEIMARFEDVLARQESRPSSARELARAVGVSERALRSCCLIFLGRTPASYARLRRGAEEPSIL
jgi:hypothetical protein